MAARFAAAPFWPQRPSTRGTQRPTALAVWQAVIVHIAMITAVNTPHTITNALIICFSSEMDILAALGIKLT
jgi:hypothetical protein